MCFVVAITIRSFKIGDWLIHSDSAVEAVELSPGSSRTRIPCHEVQSSDGSMNQLCKLIHTENDKISKNFDDLNCFLIFRLMSFLWLQIPYHLFCVFVYFFCIRRSNICIFVFVSIFLPWIWSNWLSSYRRVALHRPEYAEENGLKNEKSIKEEKGSKSAMKKTLVGWVI